MQIISARIYMVEIDGRRPVVLEVTTDEGLTGLGEAAVAYGVGATAAAAIVQELTERFLLGADPFRIEGIWSQMYDHTFWAKGGGTIIYAGISAIEQTLWDIKGKTLGVPVYELLGGRCWDQIRVYANGWSFRAKTPEEFAKAAERVVSDGYTALKLYPLAQPETRTPHGTLHHVSHRTIDRDAENLAVARVQAVRNAIGPSIDLLLDMSAELTPEAAIRVGRRMEEFDIFLFEEPVDPSDVTALKHVSEQVNLPIAVGERLYTRYGFRPVIEQHAAHILQPDIGNTGGIMEAKKIAAMAETYSMRISPHVCAGPVSTAAAVQLSACLPNFLIQELYPYRIPEHFAVVEHAPELEVRASRLPIPTQPGLGVTLASDHVAPFLWAECRRS